MQSADNVYAAKIRNIITAIGIVESIGFEPMTFALSERRSNRAELRFLVLV